MPPEIDIDALFDELCDLPRERHDEFFERHAVDDETRTLLRRLLALHDQDTSGRGPGAAYPLYDSAPERIGPYIVLDLLGASGLGVVYLARQQHPRREVAVKVLRLGVASDKMRRRFELEVDLLGRLQHPGIAQVYDSGVDGEGERARAYLAMEFIDGVPLDVYAERQHLDAESRVRLLLRLVRIVHHAHVRGVVHRELKPGNALVTVDGQLKLVDFGVERSLDDASDAMPDGDEELLTGDLGFLSPEQMRGRHDAVDTRTDVYALGAMGYQLLGGRLPIEVSRGSLQEAVRAVCEDEAPLLGEVAPAYRGDVEWILARALSKDPERRYESAGGMAADLRRHLEGRPVEAHPDGALYLMRKVARRHPAAAAAAVATGLLLAGAAVAGWITADGHADRIDREVSLRQDAELGTQTAQQARTEAEERVAEARRLAGFHASRIGAIQPDILGGTLVEGFLDRFSLSQFEQGVPESEIAASRDALRAWLEAAHPSDVTLGALRRGVLLPTADLIDQAFADQPRLRGHARAALASSQWQLGLEEDALASFEVALASLRSDPGSDPVVVAEVETRYADALRLRSEQAAAASTRHVSDAELLEEELRLERIRRDAEALAEREAAMDELLLRFEAARSAGDCAALSDVCEALLPLLREARGADGLQTLDVALAHADCLLEGGDSAEAEAAFADVAAVLEASHPDDVQRERRARRGIAEARLRQARPAEALAPFRQLIEIADRVDGTDSLAAETARRDLGQCLRRCLRLDEALAVLVDVEARCRARVGEVHVDRLHALMDIADVCWQARRYEQMRPVIQQALELADQLGDAAGPRAQDARFLESLLDQFAGPG